MKFQDKKILEKLARLDTPKAQMYLVDFCGRIKKDIFESTNNDSILASLKLLGQFVHKAPDQSLEIIDFIIKNKKPHGPQKIKPYNIVGTTHKELVVECCSLLKQMRYFKPKEVLDLLIFAYKTDYSNVVKGVRDRYYKDIKKEVGDAVEKLVSYNYHILNNKKVGYVVQRIILDYTKKKYGKFDNENIGLIKIIITEILLPNFRSFEQTGPSTITLKSGVLIATDYLKSIRKDAIDFVFKLLDGADLKNKIELVKILNSATHFPMESDYGDSVEKMICDDANYLIERFDKILFKHGVLVADAPLVQEIEDCFNIFVINENLGDKLTNLSGFYKKIRSDEFYGKYRDFTSDRGDIRRNEKGERLRDVKEKKVENYLEELNEDNLKEWIKFCNKISSYESVVDVWKMEPFRRFLVDVVQSKDASLVVKLLDFSLQHKNSLRKFVYNLMCGLRGRKDLVLWDKYTEQILQANHDLLVAIFGSIHATKEKMIRKQDVKLLKSVVCKIGVFNKIGNKFLDDSNLRFNIVNSLYATFPQDSKVVESLIFCEYKKYPKNIRVYLNNLEFFIFNNKNFVKRSSSKLKEFILDQIVVLPKIDFMEETILLEFGKNNYRLLMNVFLQRIIKDSKIKGKRDYFSPDNYRAIPSIMNRELTEFIGKDRLYPTIIMRWLSKNKFNYVALRGLSDFFNQVDGPYYRPILLKLIKSKDTKKITTAVRLLYNMGQQVDYDLCFEVIKHIDLKKDKKISDSISGMMSSTGVVSGEDGLLEAFKGKAERIKNEIEVTKNKNLKKFCEEQLVYFNQRIEDERKRVVEEKKLRQIDFES